MTCDRYNFREGPGILETPTLVTKKTRECLKDQTRRLGVNDFRHLHLTCPSISIPDITRIENHSRPREENSNRDDSFRDILLRSRHHCGRERSLRERDLSTEEIDRRLTS